VSGRNERGRVSGKRMPIESVPRKKKRAQKRFKKSRRFGRDLSRRRTARAACPKKGEVPNRRGLHARAAKKKERALVAHKKEFCQNKGTPGEGKTSLLREETREGVTKREKGPPRGK